MNRIRLLGVSPLLVACLGAMASLAAEFEIRFNRPRAVGQEYVVSEQGSSRDIKTLFYNGQVMSREHQEVGAELDARVKVLEISKKGIPAKQELTIERFVYGEDGALSRSLMKGTVILARQEGDETVFLVDGEPLPELTSRALSLFVTTTTEGVPDDDALFGTDGRKEVGDEWPIDSEKFAALLGTEGVKLAPEDIRGTAKLESVEEKDGVECLRIGMNATVDGLTLADLPPEISVVESSATMQATTLLPTDTAIGEVYESLELRMDLRMKFNEGPNAGLEINLGNVETTESRLSWPASSEK